MKNPFESGEIKNYLLLYAGVVVIMVLFFIATTLFNEPKKQQKKEFNTEVNATQQEMQAKKREALQPKQHKFKLLDKAY
jgi:p-aminobenzoyl-glutamate transporter AbgT